MSNYTKQQIEAAKQTARNLTGATRVQILSHNAMGIRFAAPLVEVLVTVPVSGYPTRITMSEWQRVDTIGNLIAP